jgi:hypothetical protein
VFATFPWPDLVTDDQRVAVAEASRRVIGPAAGDLRRR